MSTDGWNPILTVEVGVKVFAYRSDQNIVQARKFGPDCMKWLREGNPYFAYTHWMTIPEGWGEYPKFPEELTQ